MKLGVDLDDKDRVIFSKEDPTPVDSKTVLVALTLFPLGYQGVKFGAGHFARNSEHFKVASALCRVLAPGVPEPEPSVMDKFLKVSRFLNDRILEDLSTKAKVREFSVNTEFERLRELLKSKPVSHTVMILEERDKREVMMSKEKRLGWFPKPECNHKVHEDDLDGNKPRGIYPMTLEEMLVNAPVLEAVEWIYRSAPLFGHHIKALSFGEICELVAVATEGHIHANTDYSSFEASITGSILEAERDLISSVLRLLGYEETAAAYERGGKLPVWYKTAIFRFLHVSRRSGTYETAGGNLMCNLYVFYTQAYARYQSLTGDSDLNRWWATVDTLQFIMEGDDAVVPAEILDTQIVAGLGMKLSVDAKGEMVDDTDFLRKQYYRNGQVVGNVLRSMRSLYTITSQRYSIRKLMFLARCTAWSIWSSLPGHPILWAVVRRVEQLTRGYSAFKGWEKKMGWGRADYGPPPDRFPASYCTQLLRQRLACIRNPLIPAISIPEQVTFEAQILTWRLGEPLSLPAVFSAYPEFRSMLTSPTSSQPEVNGDATRAWKDILGRLGVHLL